MKMSDVHVTIQDTVKEVCDNFCKFSKTGNGGSCIWIKINGSCPFDEMLKELGMESGIYEIQEGRHDKDI